MSIKTRALVFATFFGSCLVVGLLLASLTTDHWIRASAKRTNSLNSSATINFGLFSGNKDMNLGYGLRNNPIIVLEFMDKEPASMNFWLWLGAALGTGFGLLSSAIGAIAAVLKAASSSKNHGTMILLLVANCASAISQILAFICWLVQFYIYLTHNVLTVEERENHWYSHGLASLGFSFYFVIISTVIVIVNIVILIMAYRNDYRAKRRLETPYEDKTQSAIMLY